jgi:hypothetical protein
MTSRALSTALAAAVVLTACGSDAAQRIDAPATGANIKFYNFALNAPGVNFYANDTTKLTAVIPPSGVTVDTIGTKYASLGDAGLYSDVPSGSYAFSAKPASPSFNGASIGSVSTALGVGKYYSFYLSGFYDATARQADAFVVEDAFPTTIDFAVTNVRFVNASPNAQPLQLDVAEAGTTQVVATSPALAYKAASTFLTVPPAFYDLSAHYVGSTAKLFTRTGVSFTGGRVYTITARGDMTVTSTTATNRPFLDNTANR